jgi:hypothetical protein
MSDDSSRDTTPAWPEPTAGTPAAEKDILAVWENAAPGKPINASVLVAALRRRGHSVRAAQWAIHRMIGDGRLVAEGRHVTPWFSRTLASGAPHVVVGTTIYPGGWRDYRNFQVRPTEKFWSQEAAAEPERAEQQGADAKLKQPKPGRPARVGRDEANLRARAALKARPPRGGRWSQRTLAKAIGCSAGLVSVLPAWQAYAEERGLGGKGPSVPKAVSLTPAVLAGEGRRDEELEQLIAQHQADFEESPLVSHARKHRRRR